MISRKCNVCKKELTSKNSFINQTNNLCKKHHYKYSLEHGVMKRIKKYHKTDRGKKAVCVASKKAYRNHKEKWIARAKARYAIKKGIIIKPQKCEVCKQVKPLQGHHEDYSKPLEVIFLCSGCHADADKLLENL